MHKTIKRGTSPKGKVVISWSPNFAYAIGLLTADGCLSKDGRHIDLTSKDRNQVTMFKKCLGVTTKISKKYSGSGNMSYHTQFGDVLFYKFLLTIGITPAKSKTISAILIPDKYFFDFLRGYFDGDGSSYSYYDPTYKKSYRFYISFTSASPLFIEWLRKKLKDTLGVSGYISHNKNTPYLQLKYSKREACKISESIYYNHTVVCLKRKYLKIKQSFKIINERRSGEIGRHTTFRS